MISTQNTLCTNNLTSGCSQRVQIHLIHWDARFYHWYFAVFYPQYVAAQKISDYDTPCLFPCYLVLIDGCSIVVLIIK